MLTPRSLVALTALAAVTLLSACKADPPPTPPSTEDVGAPTPAPVVLPDPGPIEHVWRAAGDLCGGETKGEMELSRGKGPFDGPESFCKSTAGLSLEGHTCVGAPRTGGDSRLLEPKAPYEDARIFESTDGESRAVFLGVNVEGKGWYIHQVGHYLGDERQSVTFFKIANVAPGPAAELLLEVETSRTYGDDEDGQGVLERRARTVCSLNASRVLFCFDAPRLWSHHAVGEEDDNATDVAAAFCEDGRFALGGDLSGLKHPEAVQSRLGVWTVDFAGAE